MKRNGAIVGFFALLSLVLLFTNCTCYGSNEGEYTRGCGYYCYEMKADCQGCGASCLDQLCPGWGVYEEYQNSVAVVAVPGVHYEQPVIEYDYGSNRTEAMFSVNILHLPKGTQWYLTAEICFLQDGALVGTVKICDRIGAVGRCSCSVYVTFNEFYNPEGEVVTVLIDQFSLVSVV